MVFSSKEWTLVFAAIWRYGGFLPHKISVFPLCCSHLWVHGCLFWSLPSEKFSKFGVNSSLAKWMVWGFCRGYTSGEVYCFRGSSPCLCYFLGKCYTHRGKKHTNNHHHHHQIIHKPKEKNKTRNNNNKTTTKKNKSKKQPTNEIKSQQNKQAHLFAY